MKATYHVKHWELSLTVSLRELEPVSILISTYRDYGTYRISHTTNTTQGEIRMHACPVSSARSSRKRIDPSLYGKTER